MERIEINNASDSTWEMMNASFPTSDKTQLRNPAVVQHENCILVMGGRGGNYEMQLRNVWCVDTEVGTISNAGLLAYSVERSAFVKIDYTIYLFGGIGGLPLSGANDYLTMWQYYTLPTPGPTYEPTKDPTADPTGNPTADPTSDPTNDPTSDPSGDPTTDPTSDPTMDPTIDPTGDPTGDPIAEPTADPTDDPSSDITFEEPTREPSGDPALGPTPKTIESGISIEENGNWILLIVLIVMAAVISIIAVILFMKRKMRILLEEHAAQSPKGERDDISEIDNEVAVQDDCISVSHEDVRAEGAALPLEHGTEAIETSQGIGDV